MNPILLDVPLQIETDRLILRAPLQAGEGNVVHEAIKDSIRELKQWLSLFQSIPTVEETEILLRNAHINFLNREAFATLSTIRRRIILLEQLAFTELIGVFLNVKLDTGLTRNLVAVDT